MKKVVSILLTAVMVFMSVSVAFAVDERSPVIIVSGMGTDQYEVVGDEKNQVWPPQSENIASAAIAAVSGVVMGYINDDFSDIGENLTGLRDLFLPLACDANGELMSDIVADLYPLSIENYPDDFNESQTSCERAICRSVGDELGYDNAYFFNYTWSRNPMDIADDLEEYIDGVIEQTGANKVSLIACSMGGTITMSYLSKYGNDKIKNVVFASTAFQGTEIVGQLFNKDVNISIYDALRYFSDFTGYDFVKTAVVILQKAITQAAPDLLDKTDELLAGLVDNLKEAAFSDVFLDTYVSMPGIWALMPVSYYESAKEVLIDDMSKYAFLYNGENSIDNYMYNVQSKAADIIADLRADGTDIYVVATCLCSGIPVQADTSNYTDNLIDVKYAGGNATVAKYGETLDSALNAVCADPTHDHLSSDRIIDASTCILPEQTWFIENVGHMQYIYGTDLCELLVLLSVSNDEISIYTYEKYPQFTKYDQTTCKLSPLTENYDAPDTAQSYTVLALDLLKKIILLLKNIFLDNLRQDVPHL